MQEREEGGRKKDVPPPVQYDCVVGAQVTVVSPRGKETPPPFEQLWPSRITKQERRMMRKYECERERTDILARHVLAHP